MEALFLVSSWQNCIVWATFVFNDRLQQLCRYLLVGIYFLLLTVLVSFAIEYQLDHFSQALQVDVSGLQHFSCFPVKGSLIVTIAHSYWSSILGPKWESLLASYACPHWFWNSLESCSEHSTSQVAYLDRKVSGRRAVWISDSQAQRCRPFQWLGNQSASRFTLVLDTILSSVWQYHLGCHIDSNISKQRCQDNKS